MVTVLPWVLLAASGPAIAWEGSQHADCGSSEEFEIALRELAGDADLRGLVVDGRVDVQVDAPVRLDLEVQSPAGVLARTLTTADCRTAFRAAVFLTASAVGERREPDVEPEPVEPAPSRPPPEPPRLRPPPSPAVSLRGLAGAAHDGGHVAALGPTGSAGVRVQGQHWALGVAATGSAFPSHGRRAPGVTFGIAAGEVEGCGVLRSAKRVALLPCASVLAGAAIGRGIGVAAPRQRSLAWVAGRVGGEARVAVSKRVGLAAKAGVQIPFLRPRFTLSNGRTLYRSGPIGGFALVGVDVRL